MEQAVLQELREESKWVDRSKPQKKAPKNATCSPSKAAVVIDFGGDSDDDKSIAGFSVGSFDIDDQADPMDVDGAESKGKSGDSGKPKAKGKKKAPAVAAGAAAASLPAAAP